MPLRLLFAAGILKDHPASRIIPEKCMKTGSFALGWAMMNIGSFIAHLKTVLFSNEQDIHVRHFNLLAIIGICASLIMGIVSLFTTSLSAAAACFILCAFAAFLLAFSVRRGNSGFATG